MNRRAANRFTDCHQLLAKVQLYILAVITSAPAIWCSPTAAAVIPKNGNFSIDYYDLEVAGDKLMNWQRVYNSKSAFAGLFGTRWSSSYETWLETTDDGSVVVHHLGGASEEVYRPDNFKAAAIPAIVDRTEMAEHRSNRFGSLTAAESYREDLLRNDGHRRAEWRSLVEQT